MLDYCPICKEKSVTTKVYIRKGDGIKNRVAICLNKSCGYKKEMPFNKGIFFQQKELSVGVC